MTEEKGLQIRSFDDLAKMASWYHDSGLAPKGDNAKKIAIKMCHAMEIGLSPASGLHNIYVINNKPCVYGKAALGLVQSHPDFVSMKESSYEEIRKTDKAWCTLIRKSNGGESSLTGEFSMEDAKRAGLLGKGGPWKQYPERMLLWRSRSFAFDLFSDALCGLYLKEELESSTDFNEKPPAEVPQYTVKQDKVVKEPKNAFVVSIAEKIKECTSVDTLDNVIIPKLRTMKKNEDSESLISLAVLRKEELMTAAEDPA